MNIQKWKEEFEAYKGETFPAKTFARWANFTLDFLYRKISGIDPLRFVREIDLVIEGVGSTGKAAKEKPSNMMSIKGNDLGFYVLGENGEIQSGPLLRTGIGSSATGYYFQGGNVVFTGLWGSWTIRCFYIAKRTRLTGAESAGATDIVLSEMVGWEELLEQMLERLYQIGDEEKNNEIFAEGRVGELLEEFLAQFSVDDVPLSYTDLSDFIY